MRRNAPVDVKQGCRSWRIGPVRGPPFIGASWLTNKATAIGAMSQTPLIYRTDAVRQSHRHVLPRSGLTTRSPPRVGSRACFVRDVFRLLRNTTWCEMHVAPPSRSADIGLVQPRVRTSKRDIKHVTPLTLFHVCKNGRCAKRIFDT